MAGRWKSSKFERVINNLGGLEWILEQLGRGRSLRSIAYEIGCSRWWLDRWIYAGSERRERVLRARAAGSPARTGEAFAVYRELQERQTAAGT